MFCKISSDLDIDYFMCDWINCLLRPREKIVESVKSYSNSQSTDNILDTINFEEEIDVDYLRLEFGANI